MSRRKSSAQTHRRRQNRAHGHPWGFRPNEDVGMQLSWAPTVFHIEEAKQLTHDAVTRTMGAARTGGVRWSVTSGPAAVKNLQLVEKDASPEFLTMVSGPIRALLAEHGGYLVAAMAPGHAPDGQAR